MAQRIVTRRRRWLLIVAAVVVLLVIFLNVMSGFYIDLLWFKEVGFQNVFWTVFWSKVVLGLLFGLVFFGILYANLLIVRRLTPPFRTFTPEQEVVERYRVAIEPYAKWILPGLSLVIALFVGIGASSQWQAFQLWRNSGGVNFGRVDPVFHRDISFYVFKLPFLHFVQGWLFSALVGVTVLVAIAHYLWGGIRLQATLGARHAAGEGPSVGAARARRAREGVGVLPREVRPAAQQARGGRGGVVHRPPRAEARARRS